MYPQYQPPTGGRLARRLAVLAVAVSALAAGTVTVLAAVIDSAGGGGAAAAALIAYAASTQSDCVAPAAAQGNWSQWSATQVTNAATIVRTGQADRVPLYGQVIAVATAMQESSLVNLDHGDRDSLGLFQQRPSQGWGTPAQIMNPVYASGQFYAHLLAVPGWQDLALTVAAQDVQNSGYPGAYAKWQADAADLVAHITGGGNGPVADSGQATATCGPGTVPAGTPAKVAAVITWAEDQEGTLYDYGGSCTDPHSADIALHCDCSSLVQQAFLRGAGLTLPRTAEQQWEYGGSRARRGHPAQPGAARRRRLLPQLPRRERHRPHRHRDRPQDDDHGQRAGDKRARGPSVLQPRRAALRDAPAHHPAVHQHHHDGEQGMTTRTRDTRPEPTVRPPRSRAAARLGQGAVLPFILGVFAAAICVAAHRYALAAATVGAGSAIAAPFLLAAALVQARQMRFNPWPLILAAGLLATGVTWRVLPVIGMGWARYPLLILAAWQAWRGIRAWVRYRRRADAYRRLAQVMSQVVSQSAYQQEQVLAGLAGTARAERVTAPHYGAAPNAAWNLSITRWNDAQIAGFALKLPAHDDITTPEFLLRIKNALERRLGIHVRLHVDARRDEITGDVTDGSEDQADPATLEERAADRVKIAAGMLLKGVKVEHLDIDEEAAVPEGDGISGVGNALREISISFEPAKIVTLEDNRAKITQHMSTQLFGAPTGSATTGASTRTGLPSGAAASSPPSSPPRP